MTIRTQFHKLSALVLATGVLACFAVINPASALPGTSSSVTASERRALVSAACEGRVGAPNTCRTCPSYAGENELGLDINVNAIQTGSFVTKGAVEAYVALEGCDGKPANFGGGVLLRKTGSAWKIVRYDSGLSPASCLRFPYKGGTTLLTCYGFGGGQGITAEAVYAQYIGPSRTTQKFLLRASENAESCASNLDYITMTSWRKTDLNADGKPDIEVRASEQRGEQVDCANPQLGPTRRHRLGFLFDGERFSIRPTDRALVECLEGTGHDYC